MQAFTNPASFNAVARESGARSRRRSLLALGGAGVLATFAGHSRAEARRKSSKTKRCKQDQQQCRNAVEDFCAQFDGDAPACEEALLPCCDSCKVGEGVICVAEYFTNRPLEILATAPA